MNKYYSTFKENISWLTLASVFFLGSVFLTYFTLSKEPELFAMLEQAMLPLLKELSEQVFGGHPLQGAVILFIHNLTTSLQVILFGVFLGIPALVASVANGAILGALAFQLGQQGVAPLPLLLAGILPHGILELPAFFLSIAFGLKLGYHIVFPLPEHTRLESLGKIFREIGNALPLIIVLLALAALLEVFITPDILLYFTA